MTTKTELLELAFAHQHNADIELALSQYNQASAEVMQYAGQLTRAAAFSLLRISDPNMTPVMDTSQYVIVATKLANAERLAWGALASTAIALKSAGVEVEW